MGSPQSPTTEQIALLEKAGQLQMMNEPKKMKVKGQMKIAIHLPRQGVSLLKLSW
jgi:xylan 1,4-beta-xylosidase